MMIALLLALTSAAEPAEADARALAQSAAYAWNAGHLGEAGDYAAQAYDALAAGDCLVTRDGARLAFMAAVSGMSGASDEPYSYFFWAAEQLDRVARGLTHGQREVARRYGIEPGILPRLDARYARSPFLSTPRPRRSRGCPEILPALNPDPPVREGGVLFARTMNPNGRYLPLHTVYAFPARLADMSPQIEGTHNVHMTSAWRTLMPFVFSPCLTVRDAEGERSQLCPEGVSAP